MAETRRRLAAILAADAVGYSRLMAADEAATVAALNAARAVFRDRIADGRGRVVDTAGDSVLAVFDSVVEAVRAAIAVQDSLRETNADTAEDRRLQFRIGVNLGDIIEQDDGTVYGDGVNVAARLEALAAPGGMMVSDSAHMQITGKIAAEFTPAGAHEVKNLPRPVTAFAWTGARAADAPGPAIPPAGPGQRPSVAIGGFEAVGPSEDIQVLADGVRDLVGESLSNQTGMVMVTDPAKADYVATARVQGVGQRYRATIQILDRQADELFASERFDDQITDLFDAQDDLARCLYSAIRNAVYLREGNKTDQRPYAEQASDSLLAQAGIRMYGHDPARWAESRAMLEVVIDREPDNFMALSMMAWCYTIEHRIGYREISNEDKAAAFAMARRAVRIQDKSDFVHITLSFLHLFCDRDFDAALRAARRALELNPNYSMMMGHLGLVSSYCGQAENGLALCTQALETNRRGLGNHTFMFEIALAHFVLDQYEEAAGWAERADALLPDGPHILLLLATAAAHAGHAEDAERTVTRLRQIHPTISLQAIHPWPFRDPAVWDRFADGLRKAGL